MTERQHTATTRQKAHVLLCIEVLCKRADPCALVNNNNSRPLRKTVRADPCVAPWPPRSFHSPPQPAIAMDDPTQPHFKRGRGRPPTLPNGLKAQKLDGRWPVEGRVGQHLESRRGDGDGAQESGGEVQREVEARARGGTSVSGEATRRAAVAAAAEDRAQEGREEAAQGCE